MDKMAELQGQLEYWLVDTQGKIADFENDIKTEYDTSVANYLFGKVAVLEDLETTLKSILKDYF